MPVGCKRVHNIICHFDYSVSTCVMAPDDLTHLEALIEKYGLSQVLSSLSKICRWKAAQVALKYQDASLARQWIELESALNDIVIKATRL